MARSNPCYYIAPSAISVTPNANGAASDLAVHVTKGTKIKVFSKGISGLGWNDSTVQQWTLAGRNRRLTQSDKPYTIYARLKKNDKSDAYLIFAPKVADGDNWLDKYSYVTLGGLATGTANKNSNDYWYVKLGDVSLPENDQRTATLDTGILGTDEFNTQWNLDPDAMPLRVELSTTIDGVDAGDKPYVKWGKELILRTKLLEGWADSDVQRFHHWTIQRNTGNNDADLRWNFPYSTSDAKKPSSGRLVPNGNIALSHARGEGDVFGGAVSSTWTVTAWGLPQPKESDFNSDSSSASSSASSSNSSNSSNSSSASASSKASSSAKDTTVYEKLAEGTINILAETVEQFAIELSTGMVNYDPSSDTYNPIDGVDVMVRATDQKGDVFKMTNAQLKAASLGVQYSVATLDQWNNCTFKGADEEVAKANIPIEAFHLQQNVNVRTVKISVTKVESASSSASSSASEASNKTITTYKELYRTPIAFVRNGEDSKEREWIFLRSDTAISFSSDAKDTTKPLVPSLISGGEVKPEEAATGDDTNKNQDGWVPQGWWDDMQGTDSKYHYEYAAYRDYVKSSDVVSSSASSKTASSSANAAQHGGRWGDFSTPRIWSYYAEDAVSYRCRWTLAGVEVYQLKCAYTGAFRGTLPLVATLMKRVGSGGETEVKGASIIEISCDGIDFSKTINASSPSFTIATDNADTKDFIQYLNNVALSALTVSFNVNGEVHNFSIPVVREADEDSIKSTIDEYATNHLLRKDKDDSTKYMLGVGALDINGGDLTIKAGASTYGISKEGIATLAGAVADYIRSHDFHAGTGVGFDGSGYGITKDAKGKYTLEIDNLVARMKMIVAELEVHEMTFIGGTVVMSSCGNRMARVEALDGDGSCIAAAYGTQPTLVIPEGKVAERFRCYFLASDGDRQIKNEWTVGQLARCKTNNIAKPGDYSNYENREYWRLVVGVSEAPVTIEGKNYHYIDLSNSTAKDIVLTDKAGTTRHVTLGGVCDTMASLPWAGDSVIGMGHCWDTDRQNVAILSVLSLGWTLYKGISAYDLPKENIVNKFGIDETIVTTDHFILRPYAAPSEMQTVAVVRGAYDDKASYGHNDMVTCDGQTWIGSGIKIGETITGQKPAIDSPYWSLAASKGIQGDKGDGYSISFLLNNVPVDVINFDTVKGLESATLEADFFNNSVAVNVNKAVITCYDAEGNVLGSPIEATNAENIVVDGGNLYLSKNCQYITTAAYDADGKILVSKSIGVVRNGESVGVKDVTYKVINNVDANASLNWDAQTAQTAYPTQKPDKGKYCYVMTIVTYTDGSTTNSVSTSYTAKDGTSVTITDRKVEYAGADSGTTAPTTDWGTNVPQLEQGKYLWTRTTITYSDGIPVVSYSVGRIGMDGAKGGTTHILYASSANPRSESDVRTTIDAAHQYYGTYQDTELNDDPKKYTNVTSWVLIKGDQGHTPTITIGSNGNWYIDGTDSGQKAQGDAGHTPSVTIGADGYWYIDGVRTSQKAQGDSYSVVFKLNDVRVDVLNFDDVTEMESATFEADFFNQGVAVNVPKATMTCYDGEGNTLGSPIEIADASNIVADGGNLYLSKSCKTITVQLLDSNSQTLGSASLGVLRNTITYGLTKMNDTAATVKASDSTTNAAFKLHYNLHYKAVKMVGTVSRNVNIATITATIENADNTMTVNALEGALSGEGSVSYDADNRPASSIPVTVKLTDGTVLYDTVPVTMEAGVAVDINKNLGQIKQTVANNAGRISTVSQKADNISLKVSNMSRVLTVISRQLDNSAAASYVGTESQRMISSANRGFTYFFYLGDNTQVIHDTYGTPSECDTMAQELNGKRGAPGVLVILSYGATSMSQKLLDELEWWGLDPSMIGTWNSARIAFAFIGESNLGRGRGWWVKASGASGVATTQARISNGHVVPQYDGGDTAQKNVLLATGIDIESHKITATADNFMVRNNSGDQTFSIDRDGNITGSGNASFRGKVYASGGEFTGTVTAAKIYGAYISGGSITGTTVTGSSITSTSADGKSVTKITGGQLTTGTTNKLIIDTPGNEPGGVLRITQGSDDVVKLGVTDATGKAYADIKGAWKNEKIARNVCTGPYLMLGQWVGQGHGEDRNTFSFLSRNFMYVKHIDAEFLNAGGMRMTPVTLEDIDFVHFRGLKDIDEEYMQFHGRSQYNHPSELYFWNSSEITFDLGDPAEHDDLGLVKNAGRILFIWQMGARIIFKGTPNPTSGNTAACMYLGRKIRGETSIDSDCLGQLNILMSDGKHWVMHYMND